METEASLSGIAPTVFDGSNYQLWAVRMEAYLEALDLWEAVEEDYEIPVLPNNPTMAQIKMQKEKKDKEGKGKGLLVCCCLNHYFHKNHVLEISKGDMGLSQERI